jgi:RNA ligase
MNYEFPHITNIADVLPAIEGRDEFVVAKKEGYTVINYNVMMADTFPDVETDYDEFSSSVDPNIAKIRRECRGIIFDTETGDIIRRPFHKFFNVNEREETQDHVIDLSRPHAILEKLDGSMIAVFSHEGKLIWGTKMVAQDFHELVEQFIKSSNIDYEGFCWETINSGYTPIFEWMHPQKRIVIDYGKEPNLILTAIRHIVTGQYVSLNGDL